jgi:hypothetical protein
VADRSGHPAARGNALVSIVEVGQPLDGLMQPLNLRLHPHQLADHSIGYELHFGGDFLLIDLSLFHAGQPALEMTIEVLIEPCHECST